MDMQNLYRMYLQAIEGRQGREALWDECEKHTLAASLGRAEDIFDSTAVIAAENLASSLLSQLTPPWSKWFGLGFGAAHGDAAAQEALEDYEQIIQSHFDRSNFYVEAHQCYLDLVILGTATMLFEEAPVGAGSAFKFTSVPMREVALAESNGRIETVFRTTSIALGELRLKFPTAEFSAAEVGIIAKNSEARINLVEAVLPREARGYNYIAFLDDVDNLLARREKIILKEGVFSTSPFICFRWMKTPADVYGRSPVMKALPDIKTANKAVELALKNASIAVSGVWQADDDGVINLENITLEPGTIIAKAVGSSGLVPLRTGADFDISQLVIGELRASIGRALLADRLASAATLRMTATEVIERADEMSRILGATYGRLQSELLTPVILRAISILKRRGEISDIMVNGREVDLKYRSPLASHQAARDARNVLTWVDAVAKLGGEALEAIDRRAVAGFLARAFGVPEKLTSN
ncbi:MAG: head-tail connector protein [Rickettsiales bacterium]|jgi:hypothetical protein|nr:head-tail connector protein [Rickettsiales bacterium]